MFSHLTTIMIFTLSLHDALPICDPGLRGDAPADPGGAGAPPLDGVDAALADAGRPRRSAHRGGAAPVGSARLSAPCPAPAGMRPGDRAGPRGRGPPRFTATAGPARHRRVHRGGRDRLRPP